MDFMSKDKKETKEHSGQDKPIKEEASISLSRIEYERLKQDAAKLNEYQDKLLRQQADFDNFRKRLDKERSEFTKYANETIILEVLIVLDDLERAVSLAEKHKHDFKSFLKGVEMILSHLYELLKKHGIRPMEVMNKQFDPLLHEALMIAESDSEDNKIIEEFQKGYLLDGRLIRTAKVKVIKKKEDRQQSVEKKEAVSKEEERGENKDSESDI